MLIALLVVLGVDLIVIVSFAAAVLGRRRWLKRQPGQFAGAIRVTLGSIDGLSPTWKRGSGRWVRDVLVWSKAPFMFRTAMVPVDRLSGEHQAPAGALKRLGDEPVVVELVCESAQVDVAVKSTARSCSGPGRHRPRHSLRPRSDSTQRPLRRPRLTPDPDCDTRGPSWVEKLEAERIRSLSPPPAS